MRGSSIKIVRHIIKGELDVSCVWGSEELGDAFFLSLCQSPWDLVHSILCPASLRVLSSSLCVQVVFVRITQTNLVPLCL